MRAQVESDLNDHKARLQERTAQLQAEAEEHNRTKANLQEVTNDRDQHKIWLEQQTQALQEEQAAHENTKGALADTQNHLQTVRSDQSCLQP